MDALIFLTMNSGDSMWVVEHRGSRWCRSPRASKSLHITQRDEDLFTLLAAFIVEQKLSCVYFALENWFQKHAYFAGAISNFARSGMDQAWEFVDSGSLSLTENPI
jgi:hypothetical protein